MSHLVTPYGTFNLIQYDTEQEFERAIVAHVNDIFGERRIYLDCKRRIGRKMESRAFLTPTSST